MNIQEVNDNLKEIELKKRYILCRYKEAFVINDFVQVVLEAISEEPVFVIENQTYFDNNSRENFYYVKADSFSEDLYKDRDIRFDYITSTDLIKELDEYLEDKLIIVQPYYFYNTSRDTFFKNGTVKGLIQVNDDTDDDFFCVPKITDMNSYENFINKKEFPIPLVSEKLIGKPFYLFHDDQLYAVKLEQSKTNDTYWIALESDDSIKKLEIDYEREKNKKKIIDCNNGFVFIERRLVYSATQTSDLFVSSDKEKNAEVEQSQYESSKAGIALQGFFDYTKKNNLCYSLNDIYNFYTCVCSSQLIILAGMSGTGKTKLPLKFAEYFNMTEKNGKLLFVPVSPSFTEPSDILGYLNPNTGIYTSAETRLVEFLKHASENPEEMHMVIFDEMNLSQIEFWFAPFISILEKDLGERVLYLYSNVQRCINEDRYPSQIEIKNNVIFVGTINLDETTKNISDRLLDRSFIINLKKESFVNYKAQQAGNQNEGQNNGFSEDFKIFMPDDEDYKGDYISNYSLKELEFFDSLHEELSKVDSQKGISFRCVKNISLYLKNKPEELNRRRAFDYAFKQTVMKKVNGPEDSIKELLGSLNQSGEVVNGKLVELFEKYSEISDFTESRIEVKNKIVELKKYGYAR